MSIKKKILLRTSLVIIVIYIFSGVFAYYYFADIFKKRAISDDKIKLHQTEQQIQYIYEDIKKYSKSIIIEPQIQTFLKTVSYNSSYSNMSARYNTLDRLRTFISLRDYVQSAILITKDGSNLYSLLPFSQDYIIDKLKEDWYKNYNSTDRSYFSNLHYIGIPGNSSDVISYIVDIKDMNKPEISIGKLVLNINLSYFQKFIDAGIGEFDDFLWLSNENAIVFKKKYDDNFFPLSETMNKLSKDSSMNIIAMEQKLGYVIIDQSADNGWKFVSYTSKAKLFQPVNKVFYFFLISTVLSLIIVIIVILPILTSIIRPITKLTKAMNRVSEGNLDINVQIASHDEIEVLGDGFNKMIHSLKLYMSQSIEDEKIKRQMAFDLLMSQVNPHFIYNVLNTVVYIARKEKNTDIVELVTAFIKLLQDSINTSSSELFTTLKGEMNSIEQYLKIQSYRYPNKFKLSCEIDESLLEAFLPKTIIQPLVENALFHGICATDVDGEIKISVSKIEEDLVVSVADNGAGMDENKIEEILNAKNSDRSSSGVRHIGIINIRDRIKYLYGDKYGITIKSIINQGTIATIIIPFVLENNEKCTKS